MTSYSPTVTPNLIERNGEYFCQLRIASARLSLRRMNVRYVVPWMRFFFFPLELFFLQISFVSKRNLSHKPYAPHLSLLLFLHVELGQVYEIIQCNAPVKWLIFAFFT